MKTIIRTTGRCFVLAAVFVLLAASATAEEDEWTVIYGDDGSIRILDESKGYGSRIENGTFLIAQARDENYKKGLEALDRRQWADAVHWFHQAADAGGADADAALYWMAYAFEKQGRVDDALEAVELLEERYPDSTWIEDGKVLEIQMRDDIHAPVPDPEHLKCETKLFALEAIARREPQDAAMQLKRFLEGDCPEDVKAGALFVLVNSDAPGVRGVITDLAKNSRDKEVRQASLHALGMLGDERSLELLKEIYDSAPDVETRRMILMAFHMHGDPRRIEWIGQVAREDPSMEVRLEAIQLLGIMGAIEEVERIAAEDPSREVQNALLYAYMNSGDKEKVLRLARDASDADVRMEAIHMLGIMGATAELQQIMKTNPSPDIKRAIYMSYQIHDDAAALIEAARTETDPALRAEIIHLLSMMDSDEAYEFMKQILEE